jgi:nicotinamidase-related amidase
MPDTALLLMDFQPPMVERFADDAEPLLVTVGRAAAAARANGLPVVHVRIAFRPGAPEVSPNNRIFTALADASAFLEDEPAAQIHPSLAPEPGDIVVTKKRVSAFAGSDLDVVLRSQGVRTLVLAGIATSGVVLSTLRQAADLDYRLVVLRDACADADEEVHHVLLDKVFVRQADVVTVDEWITSIGAPWAQVGDTPGAARESAWERFAADE